MGVAATVRNFFGIITVQFPSNLGISYSDTFNTGREAKKVPEHCPVPKLSVGSHQCGQTATEHP
jgi:hypothetical protein